MSKVLFGLICGLSFGVIDVIVMLPLKYENNRKKYEALSSAFLERFMLGLIIPNIGWNLNPIITGGLLGLGFSLPTSIITRAYIPINVIGIVGGCIIGLLDMLLIA
jgi:hypothetical protein